MQVVYKCVYTAWPDSRLCFDMVKVGNCMTALTGFASRATKGDEGLEMKRITPKLYRYDYW